MKKLFTLLSLTLLLALGWSAKANAAITVYVKAAAAPYLWA